MQDMQTSESKFIIDLSYLLVCSDSTWFGYIRMYSARSYCGDYCQMKCLTTIHFNVQ